jgi:chorismate mutase
VDTIILAAVVAVVSTVVTGIVGAFASKRFGLPGLARQVDSAQGELIDALEGRLKIAEATAAEAKTAADVTERRRAACEEEIRRLRRDVRETEGELLDLYRRTGTRPPRKLVTRHADHVVRQEAGDEDEETT